MELNEGRLQEIERIVRDNNRILHGMRRRAFIGGLIKLAIYVFVLVIAPLWIYTTYLQPLMQSASQVLNSAQRAGNGIEAQFNPLRDALLEMQSKLPDFMQQKN